MIPDCVTSCLQELAFSEVENAFVIAADTERAAKVVCCCGCW